ncbi:PepSY-associated TM helix domain-containing protein [Myroides odoratus]|uniref:Uncharacterized iron-regulated membrane protein n=1 Tax=Myroides odoratus TaxID=256 RepID=A0A378RQ20_MYROD|nr:PepSY-associated TM helix domain-containing protein [Myroides odoratus]QQU04793.1 PepSY domain-containing protein [Myroides odoratus]STZ27760.1 Uncharacterized iron-regulated membrane protein [Myroides odoratus]
MKKFLLWLHKWLGLFTGIIVVLVSLTGCIYVFHDDLKKIVYPDHFYLVNDKNETNTAALPYSVIERLAQEAVGENYPINRVDIYPAKNRTWVFRALKTDKEAFGIGNEIVYYKRVFINPYTGQVQQVEDSKREFFYQVLQLHRNLWLGSKYGGWVVGGSTVLFLVISVTGIILWWPKKWKGKTFKRSFAFDFSVNWKRLNYDVHNLLGMYSFLLAILIGFTGILFAFPTFSKSVENTLNKVDEAKFQVMEPTAFDFVDQVYSNTLDNAVQYVLQTFPSADMVSLRLGDKTSTEHNLQVRLEQDKTSKFEWIYFDKSTGQITSVQNHTYQSIALGSKVNSLKYDLHVGTIWGYPTKIMAFIGSLICASLPITGFVIWYNKSKKKKKKK